MRKFLHKKFTSSKRTLESPNVLDVNFNLVLVVVGLILVLTLQNVMAIGITPGRTTINFEPGLEKSVGGLKGT